MAYEDSIPLGRGSRSGPYQPPKKKAAPKKAPAKKAASSGGTYTIQKGDTLSAIAKRTGTTVAKLAAANGIKDPNKIMAGAKLNLGGGTSSGARGNRGEMGAVPPEGISKTGVAAGMGQLPRQGRNPSGVAGGMINSQLGPSKGRGAYGRTGVAAGTGQMSRQGRGVYIPAKGTMYRKDNTAQQTQVRKGRDLSYTVDKGNAAQQTQIRKGRKLPNARSK